MGKSGFYMGTQTLFGQTTWDMNIYDLNDELVNNKEKTCLIKIK